MVRATLEPDDHQPPLLNVLHLVGDREDAGGVLSVIRGLQSASADLGVRHTVWVNREYVEMRQPCLHYRYSSAVLAESNRHLELVAAAMPAYFELRQLLRKEPYDVLHAHQRGTLLVALLAARLSRRAVVFTNHNYGRARAFYRWSAQTARMHTVLLTPNMATHYGMSTDLPRVHVISDCFADSFLSESTVERRDTTIDSARPLRLVGLGNLLPWKKWDLVLHALARVSAAERSKLDVRIWGPTLDSAESRSYRAVLEGLISDYRLQGQVTLAGATLSAVQCLRSADWFMLPSTNEPCSVAVMEALALGLPVLASSSGGNLDIVARGCGCLFRPDDPDDLAERILLILRAAVPVSTPRAIRGSVEHRSASRVVRAYLELYENAAGAPS